MTDEKESGALQGAHLDTLAVRAGIARTGEGEHSEPIFLTSSYVFDNAADAAARFAGTAGGNVYSRYTNPSVRSFEQRIAALEAELAAQRVDQLAAELGQSRAAVINLAIHRAVERGFDIDGLGKA